MLPPDPMVCVLEVIWTRSSRQQDVFACLNRERIPITHGVNPEEFLCDPLAQSLDEMVNAYAFACGYIFRQLHA